VAFNSVEPYQLALLARELIQYARDAPQGFETFEVWLDAQFRDVVEIVAKQARLAAPASELSRNHMGGNRGDPALNLGRVS